MVSVIMSVYNAEKYLEEAIVSILNQTYKNFEFIIINDGSTDNSLSIIEQYQKQDKRIFLINRNNKGLVVSLNEGINQAVGKYIVRMDADDISLPTRVEKQVKFMENNLDIGVCGTAITGFGYNLKKNIYRYSLSDDMLKTQLLFSSIFAHPTVIMRKELFLNYNLYYKEKYKHAEDFGLWIEMAKYTKFANLKEALLKYRILENSVTREAEKNLDCRYHIIKSIFNNYLKDLGMQNTEDENRLHFNLSVNNQIKNANINFLTLKKYFIKIEKANNQNKLFNPIKLKKVLGKKWLWNLYYTKKLRGVFSKYFLYGILSFLIK